MRFLARPPGSKNLCDAVPARRPLVGALSRHLTGCDASQFRDVLKYLPSGEWTPHAMSTTSKKLVRQLSDLIECTDSLRDVLLRYHKVCSTLAASVERGEHAIEAFEHAGGLGMRHEITDDLEAFEAARHEVRVMLFALATEQGASISDVGRALAISRQLASRLAAEAKDGDRY